MADTPRFNASNLDKYNEMFRQLRRVIGSMQLFYRKLSPQEQAVAGSMIADIEFPWIGGRIHTMVGPAYMIRHSLDEMLRGWEILRRQSQQAPSKKKESGNGDIGSGGQFVN